ncbi:hypothetical protein LINGRAHAP2_LOCUS2116, partial [Linum grandiflorum]
MTHQHQLSLQRSSVSSGFFCKAPSPNIKSTQSLKTIQLLQAFQDLLTKRTIGYARELRGLYHLHAINPEKCQSRSLVAASINLQPHDINLWHWRLGHPSQDRIRLLEACNSGVVTEKITHCEICHFAKQKRLPF